MILRLYHQSLSTQLNNICKKKKGDEIILKIPFSQPFPVWRICFRPLIYLISEVWIAEADMQNKESNLTPAKRSY